MADIIISKRNEVYLQIDCEPYIKQELSEYFTFEVPDAKFMPQFKNRMWDGKIRLFSPDNNVCHYLIPSINDFHSMAFLI